MIEYENTILSGDLFDKEFVCNLSKCKGACCIAGDAGAPLEEEEVDILDADLEKILAFLPEKGKKALLANGTFSIGQDGGLETTLVEGKECAFTVFDNQGYAHCGIERAHQAGKTSLQKPISCHLYPVRVAKLSDGKEALNYHKWSICSDACALGEELKMPVFEFVKVPLTKKYGVDYVAGLQDVFRVWKEQSGQI